MSGRAKITVTLTVDEFVTISGEMKGRLYLYRRALATANGIDRAKLASHVAHTEAALNALKRGLGIDTTRNADD